MKHLSFNNNFGRPQQAQAHAGAKAVLDLRARELLLWRAAARLWLHTARPNPASAAHCVRALRAQRARHPRRLSCLASGGVFTGGMLCLASVGERT